MEGRPDGSPLHVMSPLHGFCPTEAVHYRRTMRHLLYLIGNMGSGKTTVGRLVAQRLNLPFCDLDQSIEQLTGQTIAELFAQRGERAFRELEREMLTGTIFIPSGVIATGGGVVLNERNRRLMRLLGWVIYLRASPETLWKRLQHTTDRPLLRTESPYETLQAIVQTREPLYQEADWVIDTDALSLHEVVETIVRLAAPTPEEPIVIPILPNQPYGYPVQIAPELCAHAAEAILQRAQPTRVALLTHTNLRHYAEPLQRAFTQHGVPAYTITLPSGERIKSLRTAERLYTQLLEAGCERGSLLIVVGGGVLGDLGGFVAATYMRGIPYVQVPTTLLAQVDSSVGGKVAVDLPQGKNLVGVFHQPRMTLIDPETLRTLPLRHWRNGFAEMLKYGATLQIGLWRRLQTMLEQGVLGARMVRKTPDQWTLPIARCVSLKAEVVSEDERDLSGRRALLNFGHTVGHAIEAALGYRGWLHGEAIAAGMVAEAEIGRTLGITPPEVVEELRETIAHAGLPTQLPEGIDADTLLAYMRHDKKRAGDTLSIVLLEAIGNARLVPKIPSEAIREALARCATL
jgi:shikimate kinase / 3-dehydroquinate synthase